MAAQENGGIFRLSLCGGSTPKPVYAALADCDEIDWERVLVTFGDERCVPPNDERSNHRMASEALLNQVGMTPANVMRMAGEMEPQEAADRCEGQLKKLAQLAGEPVFVHDLILLGMGDDGHTASLFPGTEALEEKERWVVANYVPKFEEHRITFTYPLIAAAKEVLFLVNGQRKTRYGRPRFIRRCRIAGQPDRSGKSCLVDWEIRVLSLPGKGLIKVQNHAGHFCESSKFGRRDRIGKFGFAVSSQCQRLIGVFLKMFAIPV